MAITKVTTPVTDFDKSTSLPGLKIPSGDNSNQPAGAAAVQGMIRNDTEEIVDSSDSAIAHYNGTNWQYFAATESPDYPTSLKMYLDAGNAASYPQSGTTWLDLTDNNNDGIISNSTWDSTGYFPFNGTNSQVTINSVTFPSSTYTIETRVRFSTLKTQGIVSWGDEASGERRSAILWSQGAGWFIYSSTYASNIPGSSLAMVANQWYDIMISMNNGSVTIYVDGISRGTGTNTINSYTSTTAYVGRTGSGEFLNGDISMVKVSDVALTP